MELYGITWFQVGSTVSAIFVFKWLWERHRLMTLLERCGIPGPKPHFLFGNLIEIHKKGGLYWAQDEWLTQYGDTIGYYLGAYPQIVTKDPNLIRMYGISQFKDCHWRPPALFRPTYHPMNYVAWDILDQQSEEQWRWLRNILTPCFTPSKLRTFVPIMQDSVKTTMEMMGDARDVDGQHVAQAFTVDVIIKLGFGAYDDFQHKMDHPLILSLLEFTHGKTSLAMLWHLLFPGAAWFLHPLCYYLEILKSRFTWAPSKYNFDVGQNLIKQRRSNPKSKRDDLLQAMLDAQAEADAQNIAPSRLKNEFRLTDMDITSNSVLFMVAGSETSATVITFTMHELTNNQKIQERLREEIMDFKKKIQSNEFDYEALNELPYLDAVLNETLRMYPPAPNPGSRIAEKEFRYQSMLIPAGAHMWASAWSLHRDPRYWPQPGEFRPERFLPKNRSSIAQFTHIPFGFGPKSCLGIKFAMLEMKLFFVQLLSAYKLVPNEGTERGAIELEATKFTIFAKNGVHFNAIKLQQS